MAVHHAQDGAPDARSPYGSVDDFDDVPPAVVDREGPGLAQVALGRQDDGDGPDGAFVVRAVGGLAIVEADHFFGSDGST